MLKHGSTLACAAAQGWSSFPPRRCRISTVRRRVAATQGLTHGAQWCMVPDWIRGRLLRGHVNGSCLRSCLLFIRTRVHGRPNLTPGRHAVNLCRAGNGGSSEAYQPNAGRIRLQVSGWSRFPTARLRDLEGSAWCFVGSGPFRRFGDLWLTLPASQINHRPHDREGQKFCRRRRAGNWQSGG